MNKRTSMKSTGCVRIDIFMRAVSLSRLVQLSVNHCGVGRVGVSSGNFSVEETATISDKSRLSARTSLSYHSPSDRVARNPWVAVRLHLNTRHKSIQHRVVSGSATYALTAGWAGSAEYSFGSWPISSASGAGIGYNADHCRRSWQHF